MKRYMFDVIKLSFLFLCCIFLFYIGLRALHDEYERYHRYDEPEGQAVKVFLEEQKVMDYIYLFFQLGD